MRKNLPHDFSRNREEQKDKKRTSVHHAFVVDVKTGKEVAPSPKEEDHKQSN